METEAQPETRKSALGNAIVLRVMDGRNERLMNEMGTRTIKERRRIFLGKK